MKEKPYSVPRVLVASGNAHKIRELREAGKNFPVELLSPDELAAKQGLSAPPRVEEDGATYFQNAEKKARAYSAWAGVPALGDDSGLEVLALSNKPGIHSARYGGGAASDEERMRLLQAELDRALAERPFLGRTAFFRCFLVLVYPEGAILSASGAMKGYVTREMRGNGGFGYDPIFEIDGLGKTLAEVDFSYTCEKGFRAQALHKLLAAVQASTPPGAQTLKAGSKTRR